MVTAMLQTGLSCRVWFPDAVMEAGEKLKEALEGRNAANIDHLRRTHPAAKFTVKGQPSTDLSPWRRLHVVITCPEPKVLAKAEADVLDLCETACDVAADFLGLSDDQVQEVFEGIRVERQEVPLRTEEVPGPPGLSFLWQATSSESQAPGNLPDISESTSPDILEGLRGTTPKSSIPKSPFIRDPNALPPGTSSASASTGSSTARKAGVPAAFASRVPTAVPMTLNPRPLAPVMGSSIPPMMPPMPPMPMPPPPLPMSSTPMTPGMPGMSSCMSGMPSMPMPMPPFPQATPTPMPTPGLLPLPTAPTASTPPSTTSTSTTPTTPAPAQKSASTPNQNKRPHTIDAHLEVARLAQAWLDRGTKQSETKRKKRSKVEVDPYLTSKAEEDPYAVMLAEAEAEDAAEQVMPPPVSTFAHKRKADPSLPGQPAKAIAIDAEEEADGKSSESSEGEESEDGEDDEIQEIPEEVGEAEASQKLELFKLGAKCCSVVAHFVSGRRAMLPQSQRLDIDQRVRLEHCRKHLQWAGERTTIWHFTLSDLREKVAWTTLCNYFVTRRRVGLAELRGAVVFIVPPDESFAFELGLPTVETLVKSLSGSLLGLQVPTYEQEPEQAQAQASSQNAEATEAKARKVDVEARQPGLLDSASLKAEASSKAPDAEHPDKGEQKASERTTEGPEATPQRDEREAVGEKALVSGRDSKDLLERHQEEKPTRQEEKEEKEREEKEEKEEKEEQEEKEEKEEKEKEEKEEKDEKDDKDEKNEKEALADSAPRESFETAQDASGKEDNKADGELEQQKQEEETEEKEHRKDKEDSGQPDKETLDDKETEKLQKVQQEVEEKKDEVQRGPDEVS